MLVLARSSGAAPEGADALLVVAGGKGAKPPASNGVAVGVLLEDASVDGASAAREAGADFIVLGRDESEAAVLLEEQLGFVLDLQDEVSDIELRVIESLPVDAILAARVETPLTLRRQLELRRLAGLAHKPLLLDVPPDIGGKELEALRDSGVAGVIIDGDKAADAAARLKEAIMALPARRKRRDDRGESVMLPQPSAGAHEHDDDDDD